MTHSMATKPAVKFAAAISLLSLAGCNDANTEQPETSTDLDAGSIISNDAAAPNPVTEPAPRGESTSMDTAVPQLAELPVSLPQLAYTYDYNWRLAAPEIGPLQRRHASLCEQQGPASCQILGMTRTGEETDDVRGELQMAVSAKQARAFGALLEDEAEDAGAEQVSAEVRSEELSKQIVDTEARVEARTQLRDRLMDVLKTRRGTVEELVQAERSVAQVNEEIDRARSWLKETEGRIAYSRVTVRYATGAPVTSDFLGPVMGALGSLGSILGWLVAILIMFGAIVAPLAGIVWAGRWINRKTAGEAVPETV